MHKLPICTCPWPCKCPCSAWCIECRISCVQRMLPRVAHGWTGFENAITALRLFADYKCRAPHTIGTVMFNIEFWNGHRSGFMHTLYNCCVSAVGAKHMFVLRCEYKCWCKHVQTHDDVNTDTHLHVCVRKCVYVCVVCKRVDVYILVEAHACRRTPVGACAPHTYLYRS